MEIHRVLIIFAALISDGVAPPSNIATANPQIPQNKYQNHLLLVGNVVLVVDTQFAQRDGVVRPQVNAGRQPSIVWLGVRLHLDFVDLEDIGE